MIQNYIEDLDKYQIQEKIGVGSYGVVYLIKKIGTDELYAAKVTKVECLKVQDQKSFLKEVTAFSRVKNPAVLSLIGFNFLNFRKEHFPTIITEYMPNSSVDKLLIKYPNFPSSKRYIILLGIAIGMECLHSHGIIHRDLKPANVLLDSNYYPHICDFGESKISELTVSAILMETYKGSPAYMAPEVFSDQPYKYKADIYSYSIITYEVLTGKNPFPGYKSTFKLQTDIKNGKRPDLSFVADKDIQEFLTKCWSENPDERPSFKEIVEEIQKDKYKKVLGVNDEEVEAYLSIFDNDDKSGKTKRSSQSLQEEADNGDDKAMNAYALMLDKGLGVDIDKKEAIRYYKMAIDKGNDKAMNNYALLLHHGDGVAVDKEEAIKYYKKSIEKGNTSAMNNYAYMLKYGDGVAIDKKEAARYFKMAADMGNVASMNNYALMLERGEGIATNKEEAIRYYKMAIENGNASAMNSYAVMLEQGDGVAVNKDEAIIYYKKAIERGNVAAMNNYARMLKNGDGVAVNKKEAIHYYKMAADKGNVNAMKSYALMLEQGDGIEINKEEAERYFKMAANKKK